MMRGRGRPRGASPMRRGPAIKVMMNMQAAAAHGYEEHARPYPGRRGRGRGRGRPRGSRARGRKELLLDPYSMATAPVSTNKEVLPLSSDVTVPPTNIRKRKDLDSNTTPPVVKRRRKELKLDSDDDFSDVDIGTLIPLSYHKEGSEDRLSRAERCRLCNKPAADNTPLTMCTSTTKVQMSQKLDKIVSAENLTLLNKQGVLCSRCSRLLNYVDRIEVELGMLKKTIVECIHKKHNLYVPDESLNFDVVAGEDDNVMEDVNNFQENSSGKEKEAVSYTKPFTEVQTKNASSRVVEPIQPQIDPYFFVENNAVDETPQESGIVSETEQKVESEVEENGDIDMCEEYLEPMFDETVISSHEGEAVADMHERLEQYLSGDQGSADAAMDVGKSFTGHQKQVDAAKSREGRNFHDDLDVRMLIEELTADPREDVHNTMEPNDVLQRDKQRDAAGTNENDKEQWRENGILDTDEGTRFSKGAEISGDKDGDWGVRDETEGSQSELDQSRDSDSSSQGRESDTKDWDFSDAEILNKETSDSQNKVISYNPDEWEDGDTQLLDKDIAVRAEETSRDIEEDKTKSDNEVVGKEHENTTTGNELVQDYPKSEEPEPNMNENTLPTKTEERISSVNEGDEDEKDFTTDVSRIDIEEVKEEFENEQNITELGTKVEHEINETDYETKQEVTEVDAKPDLEKTDDKVQDAGYVVGSEDVKKINVSNNISLELEEEKMDTDDDDDRMSVEIKWSSESENESTESDVEDDKISNFKLLGKMTDEDRTTAEESNTETQELHEMEKNNDSNEGDIHNAESAKEMQVDEGSGNPTNNMEVNTHDIETKQENNESLFQEKDTDMRVHRTDSDLIAQETDVDMRIQQTNTEFRNQEYDTDFSFKAKKSPDTDLRQGSTVADLTEKESDADLRVQQTDIDMRSQQTYTDMKDIDMRIHPYFKDTDMRAQKTNDSKQLEINSDLRKQESDNDLREHDTDTKFNEHETDSELREHETGIELREHETDTELREHETGIELRDHESDTELREHETDNELREHETDNDLREHETDIELREHEMDTDLGMQQTDADMRMQERNVDVRQHETDPDMREKENNSGSGRGVSCSNDVEDHILKQESSVSGAETEITSHIFKEKEVDTDDKEDFIVAITGREEIKEEQLEKGNNVTSRAGQHLNAQALDEGDPDIEVLEYTKTEENSSLKSFSGSNPANSYCAAKNQKATSSDLTPGEKPIADMLEEHLASILAEEPLGGEQGELFGMDVDSINIGTKSSVSVPGVTLQTDESMIRMLEEPVANTQRKRLFADVPDDKSVIIIDEDEETDNSQSAMLAGMGLIGRPGHSLPDLCGGTSDVECVDISSD